MDKNFYEILEVDKKASPEVIKKAYNTLAKKYHPDLQSGERKIEYGEKLKLINEAYETLSDARKRKEYDQTFTSKTDVLQAKIEELSIENTLLKNELNRANNTLANAFRNTNYYTAQNFSNNANYHNNVQSSYRNANYYNNVQNSSRNANYYNSQNSSVNSNLYNSNNGDDSENSYLNYVSYSIKTFIKKLFAFIVATLLFFFLLRVVLTTPFF